MAKPEIGSTGWGSVLNDHLTGLESSVSSLETLTGSGRLAEAELSATYAPRKIASFAALPTPHYLGARGSKRMPENTLEAFRYALGIGAHIIETDVSLMTDGSLVVMHDSTLDRTTNGTGNVVDAGAHTVQGLSVDDTAAGTGWPTMKVPLLDDVLREFGNKALFFLEPKEGTGVLAALLSKLQEYEIDPDTVRINLFSTAQVAQAFAAGYRSCMGYNSFSDVTDWAGLYAMGADYVASWTTAGVTTANVNAAHAAWVRLIYYPGHSRDYIAAALAAGVDAFTVDDPGWMLNKYAKRTTDSWDTKRHAPGMVANTTALPSFSGTDKLTFSGGTQLVRVGEVSPTSSTVTIDLDVTLDATSATGHDFRIFLSETDKVYDASATANGYACLMQQGGLMRTYRVTKDGAITQLTSVARTAWTAGTTRHFKFTVDATNVRFQETVNAWDNGNTADTTYRPAGGWYVYIGVSQGGTWSASNLVVS